MGVRWNHPRPMFRRAGRGGHLTWRLGRDTRHTGEFEMNGLPATWWCFGGFVKMADRGLACCDASSGAASWALPWPLT
jgi:hypothetical protein